MKSKNVIQFLFFFLSFYSFGAGIMDSFVIYHGWQFIGADSFAAVHKAEGTRIIQFYVLPCVIMTILTIMMFWKRPSNIPKTWVAAVFFCQVVVWTSSALIQIPIQFQLDAGKDLALLSKLITTDWIRIIAWFIDIVIVSRMLFRLIASNNLATAK